MCTTEHLSRVRVSVRRSWMFELIHQHLNPPDDEKGSEVQFGLNLILDGVAPLGGRP